MTYNEIKQTFEEKIAKVRTEITATEAKIAQLTKEYTQAVQDFAYSGGKLAANTRTFAKEALEKARAQLADLTERANVLEVMRLEQLRQHFPELIEGRNQAVAAMNDEYRLSDERLLTLRAETLIELARLGASVQKTRELHNRVEGIAQKIGVQYKEWFNAPVLNLHSQHAGVDKNVIPTHDETTEALYQGKLPPFVQYYRDHGEFPEAVKKRFEK